jgi:hypothetical protein
LSARLSDLALLRASQQHIVRDIARQPRHRQAAVYLVFTLFLRSLPHDSRSVISGMVQVHID